MTQTQEHTPGPLEAKQISDPQWGVHVKGEEFKFICLTAQANDAANAARIVACVNFCEGVTNERLAELAEQDFGLCSLLDSLTLAQGTLSEFEARLKPFTQERPGL